MELPLSKKINFINLDNGDWVQCGPERGERTWSFLTRHIHIPGDVAQMVERSLSMREALGSTPSFSND
ncbi:hypothetical protein G6F17_013109 [Rhizopus arrhizus]|nr:hypothetical protein G6F23_013308 [Rhizopus arrhizus]KAG0758810.1 hypothetical protein G6F22_019543 [Rhizopus arrhizus]KAG0778281.1 hypothetical protein G6F21_013052 [Rhizopus arrhizus]KAG0814942.1 hypothetical protein G6F18_013154 [Rhizopus arrhizus]KAG0846801.1 hypothetical protein G6F17_013109 [Rhizopus arrhizus]